MDIKTVFPNITSMLENLRKSFSSSEPPPTPASVEVMPGTTAVPHEAIKDLQRMLNHVVKPSPPLAVDGWWGPKTDAAYEAGIKIFKAQGLI